MPWDYEGIAFYMCTTACPNHVPLYRAWNGSDHFYTTSVTEYNGLPSSYSREGIAGYIANSALPGHVPLYRLYGPHIDDHMYTASKSEHDNAAHPWVSEGIQGYVIPGGASIPSNHVPVYRSYNSEIGDHFLTTSADEIVSAGGILFRYSTGCVSDYGGCPGNNLPLCVPEGEIFRFWYDLAGFQRFSRWDDGNVWGSDFRDAANGDLEPQGGSDIPDIYLFAGHGTCQNPPVATSPDFINTCGNFGTPDATRIGTQSRWGNGIGNLKFAFIDASCPMDLVSIRNEWFPVFQGLHVAVGHSGTTTQDCLDSTGRGALLAAYTSGALPYFIPHLSVGDAWMIAGIIDIQRGCCAVALAAGNDRADAIDRRENEKVREHRSDPTPNWFAWKWMCRT
ncbi:MAG: DUF6345 domain-containing protein [Candidatus Thorarchaeota archaeon]